ncbi:MAG: hypothetical protein ACLQNE_30190 [Thermoguttaceae bacterium]
MIAHMQTGVLWIAVMWLAATAAVGQESRPREQALAPEARGAYIGPNVPWTPGAAPKYDALDAGRDAYLLGEWRRQQAIERQVRTIDRMAWYSGLPTVTPYPPDRDTAYAYGLSLYSNPRVYRRADPNARQGLYPPPVFEPWPVVPGDIFAYPYVERAPQPIGHQVIVTGPGSYIYRPIYSRSEPPLQAAAPQPGFVDRAAPIPPPPPAPVIALPANELAPADAAKPPAGGAKPDVVPAPPPAPRAF